jgi:putative membrane protein
VTVSIVASRPGSGDRLLIRTLLAAPLLLLLVLFALSNVQPVRLGIWPTDLSLEWPLSVAVLVPMAVAFLVGALMVWGQLLALRRRTRRAEYAQRLLEAQVQELKARLNGPPLPPPE